MQDDAHQLPLHVQGHLRSHPPPSPSPPPPPSPPPAPPPVIMQLRPMSDTSRCLSVPGANYTNNNTLALAPCAAVPEQYIFLPSAGQSLLMFLGPIASNKVLDLNNFNTTPGARVVVSAGSRFNNSAVATCADLLLDTVSWLHTTSPMSGPCFTPQSACQQGSCAPGTLSIAVVIDHAYRCRVANDTGNITLPCQSRVRLLLPHSSWQWIMTAALPPSSMRHQGRLTSSADCVC
jgi:hypothetical protein